MKMNTVKLSFTQYSFSYLTLFPSVHVFYCERFLCHLRVTHTHSSL